MGDLPGAHALIDRAEAMRRRYTLTPDLETLIMMIHARVSLEEGETEQALQTIDACLDSHCGQFVFAREWALIVKARILVRTGRPAEMLELLAGWLESAKAGSRGRNWLSICLLTALARDALGDRQAAFQFLSSGLAFAQANGYRLARTDEGEPLRALLADFRVQFPQSPYADFLADILPCFPAPLAGKPGTLLHAEGMVESLSAREVEILRLVCQGLSNQEIARRLVLAVGTVKFHIHNIFGKLGVRDRPQAIAKAGHILNIT
jgi:LuxR family maltose regulon positive regulatory protein